MKNPKKTPSKVENLEENDPRISNDDLGENTEQTPVAEANRKQKNSSEQKNKEDSGQDGERRIETPQFPVEGQKKPDPSDNPQDEIDTIAP